MPTTQDFNAGTHGNGFPFCLNKVDVSGWDDYEVWTLDQAIQMYWELYEIEGFFTFEDTDSDTYTAYDVRLSDDISYTDTDGTNTDNSDYSKVKPHWRVCPDEGSRAGGKYTDPFSLTILITSAFNVYNFKLDRYYDGVTTDEANFVGYGVRYDAGSNLFGEVAFAYGGIGSAYNEVTLATAYNAADYTASMTVTNVTLNGIPLLKISLGTDFSETNITGLEFYTYA